VLILLVDRLGQSDPLIKDALMTLIERGNFIKSLPEDQKESGPNMSKKGMPPASAQAQCE
jgi:pyruvate,water dikinase